jgi:hypothetical protein
MLASKQARGSSWSHTFLVLRQRRLNLTLARSGNRRATWAAAVGCVGAGTTATRCAEIAPRQANLACLRPPNALLAPSGTFFLESCLPQEILATNNFLFTVAEGEHVWSPIAVAFQALEEAAKVQAALAWQQMLFVLCAVVGH